MTALSDKQSVLIVDDAKENITVLAELLKSDFIIRAATSGKKALEIAFSDNPPDLILLDILMPEMDGYEVCKTLQASSKTKNIPVIFITGKVSEDDEINGFKVGAVDYITKPFNPFVVKVRVNTHAELKKYRDYLEDISYLDGLTEIPNRRKFNEFLNSSWKSAIRESAPISIILMDIDKFKLFNDHYGHQEGDMCLHKIAKALSTSIVRKSGLVARFGGEEFACVLSNTNLENAVIIAERLRTCVMELQIPHAFSDAGNIVTISLGVASIIPNANSSFDLLVKASDEALYISKESGRNKVSTAPQNMPVI